MGSILAGAAVSIPVLSLDYVYKNEPRGSFGVGRLIDKSYLNSIGWRGIRLRKANLEKSLRQVVEMVHKNGAPISHP